jgi:hypothetical protein
MGILSERWPGDGFGDCSDSLAIGRDLIFGVSGSSLPYGFWPHCARSHAITPAPPASIDRCSSPRVRPGVLNCVFMWVVRGLLIPSPLSAKSAQPQSDRFSPFSAVIGSQPAALGKRRAGNLGGGQRGFTRYLKINLYAPWVPAKIAVALSRLGGSAATTC